MCDVNICVMSTVVTGKAASKRRTSISLRLTSRVGYRYDLRHLASSSRWDRFRYLSGINRKRLQIQGTVQRIHIRRILEHHSDLCGFLVRRRACRSGIHECLRRRAIVDAGCTRGLHSRVFGVPVLRIISECKTMENHGKITPLQSVRHVAHLLFDMISLAPLIRVLRRDLL